MPRKGIAYETILCTSTITSAAPPTATTTDRPDANAPLIAVELKKHYEPFFIYIFETFNYLASMNPSANNKSLHMGTKKLLLTYQFF